MHANAESPITTTDVAQHVGSASAACSRGSQRQVQASPNSVLRGIRFDRVRAELRYHAVGEATVSEVARRWGFAHAGRFSAAYAKRFGELPSETLRRRG